MPAITITAANVRPLNKRARPVAYTASAAITAGQPVHFDTTTQKVQAGDNADYTNIVGIAMTNAAADGDLIYVQDTESYEVGGTVVEGQTYYLLQSGGIGLYSDIGSDSVIRLFYATTTSTAVLDIKDYNVAL